MQNNMTYMECMGFISLRRYDKLMHMQFCDPRKANLTHTQLTSIATCTVPSHF